MTDIALAMWEENIEGVPGVEPWIYFSEVRNWSGVIRQT